MMEWYEALALLLGSIMFLMALGMPVALAFLAANILGAWMFMGGERGVSAAAQQRLGGADHLRAGADPAVPADGRGVLPHRPRRRMFNAIDRLLGRLPGRLSYVTVLGGTGFSTLSGSSMGSTALWAR
jgi:TRAP-type mannitol/chloroaromatic compound transport system permease large subunit